MRISRFEFGSLKDFRGDAAGFEHMAFETLVEELEQEVIAEPPKPTFSEDQLNAAREEGYKRGRAEGLEEGLAQMQSDVAERERAILQTLQSVARDIGTTTNQYDQRIAEQSTDIMQFVMAVAKKIAGEALSQRPELAVQELIRQCLPVILAKPRLIIETHSDMREAVETKLIPFLSAQGFEGEVQFRPNDAVAAHDAKLEWQSGNASRTTAELWQEIEALLADISFFSPPSPSQ